MHNIYTGTYFKLCPPNCFTKSCQNHLESSIKVLNSCKIHLKKGMSTTDLVISFPFLQFQVEGCYLHLASTSVIKRTSYVLEVFKTGNVVTEIPLFSHNSKAMTLIDCLIDCLIACLIACLID